MINTFLIAFTVALIWVFVASIFDIKTREIPDWLNFSLLSILSFIFISSSLLNKDVTIFLFSLCGIVFCFILSNLLYYWKVFGGGDAKLLIALGPMMFPKFLSHGVLAPSKNMFVTTFITNLLFVASVYGIIWTIALIIINRKKIKRMKKGPLRKQFIYFLILGIVLSIFNISFIALSRMFLYLSILSLALPFLFLMVKIADDLMVKDVRLSSVMEGDILAKDIVVRKGQRRIRIKQTLRGLSENDIALLKKSGIKSVRIKYGMPFAPVFFLALIVSLFGNILILLIH